MRIMIRNAMLVLNYGIAVAICLVVLVSQQLALTDKAILGFSAICIGMILRRVINWILPEMPMPKNSID